MEPLKRIEGLFSRTHGSWLEAEVFSLLQPSPYVVRSFEFALADGAVDCEHQYGGNESFAERFRKVMQRRPEAANSLLLFEVKSSIAGEAGAQQCKIETEQLHRVGFTICIYAADTSYVDVIPNYNQDPRALESETALVKKKISVNTTRKLRVGRKTYGGLDPCSAPYRMPRWMLPRAIQCIRDCVKFGSDYVNPWTGVVFQGWRPATAMSRRWIQPGEHTPAYTAYEQTLEILRCANRLKDIDADFVGMQPRLADLRLKKLIQLKADTAAKGEDWRFSDVPVARDEDGGRRRYYFNAFERFDFLLYQFEYGKTNERVILCIPEQAIPDSFYTSTALRQDFSPFERFKIDMDEELTWMESVAERVRRFPQPRRDGLRPLRNAGDFWIGADGQESDRESSDSETFDTTSHRRGQSHGRQQYEAVLATIHDRFYRRIMAECARRKSGLLVVFARNHLVCDFGMCRYIWTDRQRVDFLELQRPPETLHSLLADMPVVPICVYGRHLECWHQGPSVTAAQFRRLDSNSLPRLILWDIYGPDVGTSPTAPVVIPSEDLQPTHDQAQLLRDNLLRDKGKGQWHQKTPRVTDLLRTGLFASQYTVTEKMFLDERRSWSNTWALLDRFTRRQAFEHPRGLARDPSAFSSTLRELNQRLQGQHRLDGLHLSVFQDNSSDEEDLSDEAQCESSGHNIGASGQLGCPVGITRRGDDRIATVATVEASNARRDCF